jgi:hypothetical protein
MNRVAFLHPGQQRQEYRHPGHSRQQNYEHERGKTDPHGDGFLFLPIPFDLPVEHGGRESKRRHEGNQNDTQSGNPADGSQDRAHRHDEEKSL